MFAARSQFLCPVMIFTLLIVAMCGQPSFAASTSYVYSKLAYLFNTKTPQMPKRSPIVGENKPIRYTQKSSDNSTSSSNGKTLSIPLPKLSKLTSNDSTAKQLSKLISTKLMVGVQFVLVVADVIQSFAKAASKKRMPSLAAAAAASSGLAGLTSTPVLAKKWSLLQSKVDSVMGIIERSVQDLPNFPRLHPQECLKRTICEAHNQPDKFGAAGLSLRVLFPS